MNGKGSRPRPLSVDRKTYENNWNTIFGKTPTPEQEVALQELSALGQLQGDDSYNPLVKPMSTREPYEGYSWIKVKRAKPVEIDGVKYVTEEHHIEETTFLIEEVRKLAKELRDVRSQS